MGIQAEQLIAEMEKTNILMTREMTFVEYTDELVKFQDMITKMVLGSDYEDGMRLDEAIFRMEAKGRERGVRTEEAFRKGLAALRAVNKEIAISFAGKKGENLVARTLEFVERPNTTMYRNIYVTDGVNETELDNVILTDSGIVILEVKNTKDDMKITLEGRLVHSDDACYEKKPLGEKMRQKRALLKQALEEKLLESELDIPVYVESFIVFSAPKGMRFNVDDQYHREKWCFRTGLTKKIEYYIGRTTYSIEQLSHLNEILGDMEAHVKRFESKLNFDEVRKDIATALVLVNEEIDKTSAVQKTIVYEEKCDKKEIARKTAAVMASAVAGVAGVGVAVGLAVLGARKVS